MNRRAIRWIVRPSGVTVKFTSDPFRHRGRTPQGARHGREKPGEYGRRRQRLPWVAGAGTRKTIQSIYRLHDNIERVVEALGTSSIAAWPAAS